MNSGVNSYSPSIYYKKIEHFINEGYQFDHALVFLDISDIFDELFIKFNEKGDIVTENKFILNKSLKQKFYDLGEFLRENTITT